MAGFLYISSGSNLHLIFLEICYTWCFFIHLPVISAVIGGLFLANRKSTKKEEGTGENFERILGPPEVTVDPLISLVRSAEEAHLLQFALEKKLFDLFGPAETAAGVAAKLGYDVRKTTALLDTLVSMGLLLKESSTKRQTGNEPGKAVRVGKTEERNKSNPGTGQPEHEEAVYSLSALSSNFLKESSPYCCHDLLKRRFSRLLSPQKLEEKMTRASQEASSKPAAAGQAQKDPEEFTRVMVQNARGSSSIRRLTGLIARHLRFHQARRMLDLGGSHGLYTAALCHINPRLEGVVFDLPEVVAVARKYVEAVGLSARIELQGGNFYHDSLGSGYQLVLAVNVFHRPPEMLEPMMEKIYSALDDGGVLYLQHRYLNKNRTAPRESVMFYLKRSLEVDSFYLPTLQEAVACGTEAGFRLTGLFRFRGGDTCVRFEKR